MRLPLRRALLLAFLFSGPLLLFGATASSAELGRPLVRVFTPREYQGDPLCQAVIQGPDGVMLVANNTAALAFDGITWQPIAFPAESIGVMQLTLGHDGRVYAAGGNVLGYIDGPVGQKEYRSLLDRLPAPARAASREFRVAAGREGLVYTDGVALGIWREGGAVAVRGTLPANAQLFAAAGRVFVKGDDAALHEIVDHEITPLATDPLLHGAELVLVEVVPGGVRLLTRDRGFLVVADGSVRRLAIEADRLLAGQRLLAAQRLADNTCLVVFTPNHGGGGLFLSAEGNVLGRLDGAAGISSNVRSLATDREGGLWAGLETGLARLQWPSAVTLFDSTRGVHGFVTSVARQDGVLYAGTLSGLYRLRPGQPDEPTATFEKIFAGAVYDLLPDADAGLLVRAAREIAVLTPRGVEVVLPQLDNMGNFWRSRHEPRRLWLNTTHGLRSVYRAADGWRDEGFVPGFTEHVTGVFELPDRTLWIATFDRGLMRLRFADSDRPHASAPEVQRFAQGAGLPEFNHSAIAAWQDEPLFYFERAARPYRFDAARGEFHPLAGTASLPTDLDFNCWASMPAGRDLWFTNNAPQLARHTILRLPGGEGAPQILPHHLADTAGKIWRFIAEPSRDGAVLWICSVNGLLRVDLDHAFPPAAPLHTLLRADGVSEGASLPAEKTVARFAFSAPRFQPGATVQYQTRLVGIETAWSAWSAEPARTYARLPRGDYRFEVRARAADGLVSAPVGISFTLFPPWWKSDWALALAAVTALALVIAATRALALRALRRRLELLKAQAAVEHERLRLARDLHDDIGSGLGRVILFAGEAERANGDPAKLSAALGRMRGTAHELVQHAREIVWAVSPQHDSVASLAERVGDYALETLHAAGIACEVDIPVDLPAWPLRSDARHNLFLAAKEALHNCIKYAGARKVTVSARVTEKGLFTITIADNGCGFAPGECRGTGHGLRNLAQRAESLGGSAEIVSAPNQGTRVTLRVPVAAASA